MNPTAFQQTQQRLIRVGIVFLLASLITAFFSREQFFRSYLFAYTFWFGITMGSMAILFLYSMTGGSWGAVIRRILEASIRTLPLLAILFIPILTGLFQHLYPWTDTEHVQASKILQEKAAYLNIPFFIIRAVVYFVIWILFMRSMIRWSDRLEQSPQPTGGLEFLGGIGLLLYGLTMTFAAVDWLMSLEPHWFSTIYGLLIIGGQVLSAFAFSIAVAALLSRSKPYSSIISKEQFHDLGNLMLAFVMIWAYLSFSQFLIIWSGNLPEETPWYLHRIHGGWQYMALILIVLHFALPFLLLLSRSTKRNPRILGLVSVGVLIMRWMDLFWLTAPEFHQGRFSIHLLDFLLPLGLGALWLSAFLRYLSRRALVVLYDPSLPLRPAELKEVLEDGKA